MELWAGLHQAISQLDKRRLTANAPSARTKECNRLTCPVVPVSIEMTLVWMRQHDPDKVPLPVGQRVKIGKDQRCTPIPADDIQALVQHHGRVRVEHVESLLQILTDV